MKDNNKGLIKTKTIVSYGYDDSMVTILVDGRILFDNKLKRINTDGKTKQFIECVGNTIPLKIGYIDEPDKMIIGRIHADNLPDEYIMNCVK